MDSHGGYEINEIRVCGEGLFSFFSYFVEA